MRALPLFAAFIVSAESIGQSPAGTIVIYRLRGASFGLIHYSQGEHPTIFCNGTKLARISENRIAKINAAMGSYSCEARQQPPGTMDASSEPTSLTVKSGETHYLRLEVHFGHIHFILREVPAETAKAETAKIRAVDSHNLYLTTILLPTPQNHQ